jgi:hypothetical protein
MWYVKNRLASKSVITVFVRHVNCHAYWQEYRLNFVMFLDVVY